MSKERELLKEVLKVLEWNGIMGSHDTYNSIKELLAQPEQEAMRQQVIFRDDSGKLVTVDVSTIKSLVERYTEEYSGSSTRHVKGYKDRSWGI